MSFGLSFCVISGGSRGIGQAIAVEFAKKYKEGSVILLFARSQEGLEETKKLVEDASSNVKVQIVVIDLEKAGKEVYFKAIHTALENVQKTASDFEHAIVVHNAASINGVTALDLEDTEELQCNLALNFISPVVLNSQFFKIFGKETLKRTAINITSGAGVSPRPRMALYGAGKAARNQFFRTLALEEPTIKVLNYDPGAVETVLFKKFSSQVPGVTYEQRKEMLLKMGSTIRQPLETVQVLVEYLEDYQFKSGDLLNVHRDLGVYEKQTKKRKELMS